MQGRKLVEFVGAEIDILREQVVKNHQSGFGIAVQRFCQGEIEHCTGESRARLE